MNLKSLFFILWSPMPLYAADIPEPPPFWKYEAPTAPERGSLAGQAPTAETVPPTAVPFPSPVGASPAGDSSVPEQIPLAESKPTSADGILSGCVASPNECSSSSQCYRCFPHYSINGDGTVTDTTTGLMWKRCAEGQAGNDCSNGKAKVYTWNAAMSAFHSGITFAGYSDWRIPTLDEAKTLTHCTYGTLPALYYYCSGASHEEVLNDGKSVIDQSTFPNLGSLSLWSSEDNDEPQMKGLAWYFTSERRSIGYDSKNTKLKVLLVRSSQ